MSVFWHGGAPGLGPGDWLLPRAVTGMFRPYDVLDQLHAAGRGGWLARCGRAMDGSPEYVYVTAWRMGAWDFAAGYSAWLKAIGAPGSGVLYRCEADCYREPDPTFPGAFAVARALITEVEEEVPLRAGRTTELAVREMRQAYEQWREEFNGGADRWPRAPQQPQGQQKAPALGGE